MMIFWKYPINFLFFVGFALFFAHLPSVSLKSPTAKARPTNNFCTISLFQHTAARRRLGAYYRGDEISLEVSTHSRAMAAGRAREAAADMFETVSTHSRAMAAGGTSEAPSHTARCFNTQPREGG